MGLQKGGQYAHDDIGRTVMIGLSKIWQYREVSIATRYRNIEVLIFAVVMHGSEPCTERKQETQKTDAFDRWSCRQIMQMSWTTRVANACESLVETRSRQTLAS